MSALSYFSDTIDAIRPSIVQITYLEHQIPESQRQARGRRHSGFNEPEGTGFFVNNDGYVVTAKHVVDTAKKRFDSGPEEEGKHAIAILLPWPNIDANFRARFRGVPFDVIAADSTHDLAVLRVRQNPFAGDIGPIRVGTNMVDMPCAVARLNPARPRDGTSIAVSGYPLNEFALVTNAGVLASSWAVDVETSTPSQVNERYLGDLEVNHGNSGGPAYLIDDGSVIGVCIATKTTVYSGGARVSTGLAELVPVRYAIDLLDRQGIVYELA
jgi:S1-C subfamily serine protease